MAYEIPPSIAEAHRSVCIVDRSGQFDHRGMVLRAVCDLETVISELLIAFFRSRNPSVSALRAQKELFSENAMLSSLTRMVRLGRYLALIDDDEAHDLRLIARLRNMYAHGPKRDQFYRDPESAYFVRQLRLYTTSSSVLVGFDEQAVFLASYNYLKQRLCERAQSLQPDTP
jgi:hypothetical protein